MAWRSPDPLFSILERRRRSAGLDMYIYMYACGSFHLSLWVLWNISRFSRWKSQKWCPNYQKMLAYAFKVSDGNTPSWGFIVVLLSKAYIRSQEIPPNPQATWNVLGHSHPIDKVPIGILVSLSLLLTQRHDGSWDLSLSRWMKALSPIYIYTCSNGVISSAITCLKEDKESAGNLPRHLGYTCIFLYR